MAYKVVRSVEVERDLGLIFDHLIEAYMSFGDALSEAFERATTRILDIESDMEALGKTPYQGTFLPHLLNGLRSVTKNHAIFYFDLSEETRQLRVLAVFFGGQDHQRHMLKRLMTHRGITEGEA